MDTILPIAFLIILSIILIFNLLMLPANWVILGLIILWKVLGPTTPNMNMPFFILLCLLVVLGEGIEYITQAWGSKKYGATTGGLWAGIIGAFIGSIIGFPFMFGIGAFFGAFTGAWIGCYIFEISSGRSRKEASLAAKGTLLGKLLGIIIKFFIGIIILIMTYRTFF